MVLLFLYSVGGFIIYPKEGKEKRQAPLSESRLAISRGLEYNMEGFQKERGKKYRERQ